MYCLFLLDLVFSKIEYKTSKYNTGQTQVNTKFI